MLKNTQQQYGTVNKLLHWSSALIVFALFGVGFWMVELSYYDAGYQLAPHYHKSVGVVLGCLILIRIIWRLYNPKPSALATHSRVELLLAYLAHLLLYTLIFCVLIAGYLISTEDGRGIEVFNWFTFPALGQLFEDQADIAGNIHRWLAYALIALSSVHGIAALKHHFYDKDDTLKRMF